MRRVHVALFDVIVRARQRRPDALGLAPLETEAHIRGTPRLDCALLGMSLEWRGEAPRGEGTRIRTIRDCTVDDLSEPLRRRFTPLTPRPTCDPRNPERDMAVWSEAESLGDREGEVEGSEDEWVALPEGDDVTGRGRGDGNADGSADVAAGEEDEEGGRGEEILGVGEEQLDDDDEDEVVVLGSRRPRRTRRARRRLPVQSLRTPSPARLRSAGHPQRPSTVLLRRRQGRQQTAQEARASGGDL